MRTRAVDKTFGEGDARTVALRSVDFEARMGELLMIVGPSGCGKTTLLSVVAGTLECDGGEISVFGSELHAMNRAEVTDFRKRNIGFIFQQFNLIPTITVAENVSVPLLIAGVGHREARDRAHAMLKQVGLEDKGDKRPTQLSGGQQQRVAIGRALIHEPRLVICDEPTSALDSENGQKIMGLLCDVARAPGRSVIVVTHDNRAFRYADRMTEMEDGRVNRVHENPQHTYRGTAH